MAEKIQNNNVRYYINHNYSTTNMVATLWCAKSELEDNLIISYGDIIYESSVLQKLIESPHDISVIVDKNWEAYWRARFQNPLIDAETLIIDRKGRIINIGQKPNSLTDIQGQYIGLMKFQKKGIEILNNECNKAETVTKKNGYLWGRKCDFYNLYLTDLLQGIIDDGNEVYEVPIHGKWLEMDSTEDYKLILKSFNNRQISSF